MPTSTATATNSARCCPVCQTSSGTVLFRQSFQTLEEVGLLNGYDVKICDGCGMAYADGIPSQADFDAYYSNLSKYEYQHRGGKESEADERRLHEVACVLRSLIADPLTRVLEIGCANGRMLGFLKSMGYPNVSGVDPSPACAEAARRLYNVPVITTTIFRLPECDQAYDFVILLGVLEHLRDVREAIAGVRSVLSPAGKVYIEVPDASRLVAEQDAPFQELSTEHINFFSPTSLQYVVEAAGFATLACNSEQRPAVNVRIASGLFQRAPQSRTNFPWHQETEVGLRDYLQQCRQMDEEIRRRISRAAGDGKPIIVWGVGTHTRRLLANGVLAAANIVAFVDSNPKYQGQQLHGTAILAPEALYVRCEPILISSYAFQSEIERQIRHELKLGNEVILLYEVNHSGMNC